MEFYASRIRDINKGYWMSFENHPRLEETKKNIYIRCLPCLEKLYEQLISCLEELSLENPLNCWKVGVVLNSLEECLELLSIYEEECFPTERSIRGRIGTSDKESPSIVIIFHMLSEDERDRLIAELQEIVPGVNKEYSLFYERGCGDLYGVLCGDWRNWQGVTPIENYEQIPIIREKVQKLLRGEY